MRIILCFLLTLVAVPAWAEWVKASWGGAGTLYIDIASIRFDGNFRKVWQLQDLKERDKNGEMSRRSLAEYDCKHERFRYLSMSTHSKPMAGGKTLEIDDGSDKKWHAIPPNSMIETVLKFVCAN